MAERYHTEYVPEVAKEMITSNNFTAEDIVRIGRAQTDRILQKAAIANQVLFCDTDVVTTAIYSEVYLGMAPKVLADFEQEVRFDQYFLFDIDVAWVPDGLRDLGGKRVEMFDRFKSELERRRIPYILVSGSYEDRERKVIQVVDALLAKD
jgi:HTH-type transcriptional repressor of NAD biosynthesis genes